MRNIVFIFIILPFLGLGQGLRNAIAQQGQVSSVSDTSVIRLGKLKACASCYGYGEDTQGGWGGTIYEVNNLNDSGPGSLREAVTATGPRVAIIKVGGRVNLSSMLYFDDPDLTIIGQTAPGDGLHVNGNRWYGQDISNMIIRHITVTVGNLSGFDGEYDAIGLFGTTGGIYIDHISAYHGLDELISIRESAVGGTVRATIANSAMAEAYVGPPNDHNTATILGPANGTYLGGKYTYSRLAFFDVSHRFPNGEGDLTIIDSHNLFISNWAARLARINSDVQIDWVYNYVYAGNRSKSSGQFNKVQLFTGDNPSIYTRQNYIEGFETTPDNDDSDSWTYFTGSQGVTIDGAVGAQYFTTTRHSDASYPPQGLLDAVDVQASLFENIGHSRASDINGNPVEIRDDLIAGHINRVLTNTTRSTYIASADWTLPSVSGGTPYTDADGDHIADAFETMMGGDLTFTDKPDFFTVNGRTFDNREYAGGAYNETMNYVGGTLTGENLYTWLRIFTDYLAGDFELLAEVN